MNILVIGASRGIGLEFVRQYLADGCQVTATARDTDGLEKLGRLGASALRADIADAASCMALQAQLQGAQFDIAIVCAGLGSKLPTLSAPDNEVFDSVMHTNVLGVMRVMPILAATLVQGGRLAVLSSGLASMAARTQAGNWLYRASKAALNSVLKDVALQLDRRVICVSLHPGWVRTDMGGANAALDVSESAAGMRRVIAGLGMADSGSFRSYTGEVIPW